MRTRVIVILMIVCAVLGLGYVLFERQKAGSMPPPAVPATQPRLSKEEQEAAWEARMKREFPDSEQRRLLLTATDEALAKGQTAVVVEKLNRHREVLDPVLLARYQAAYDSILSRADRALAEGQFDQVFDELHPLRFSLDPVLNARYVAAAQGITDGHTKASWAAAEARSKAREAEYADALQRWTCTNLVRSIDIWTIKGTTAKRRVRYTYADGSSSDDNVPITRSGDRVKYHIDPERNGYILVTGGNRMSFWEYGEEVPGDVQTTCILR